MFKRKNLVLQYFVEVEKHNGYGTSVKVRKITQHKFFAKLRKSLYFEDKAAENTLVVSTWLSGNRYVCVLDIDTEDALLAALTSLERRGIDYEVIKSSFEGHYWLITNYVGKLNEVVHLIQNIPGVDPQFAKFVEVHKRICLRGVFRATIPPNFVSDGDSLDGLAYEWFMLFKQHFEEVAHIYKDHALKHQLQKGDLSGYLADPSIVH